MADQYKILSLQDIFEKIPADKIKLCLSELGEVMIHLKKVNKDFEIIKILPMTWIDDGKGELKANVTIRDKSDTVDLGKCSYTVNISGDNDG